MKSSTKKGFLAAAATMLLSVLVAGSAFASQYGTGDLTSLTSYLNSNGAHYTAYSNSNVSGSYYFTPLAYEAAYTDQLRTSTEVLFTNTSLPTEFGTSKQGTAASTYFYDTHGNKTYLFSNTGAVDVFKLTQDWTVGGVTLTAGTLIIGLNDSSGTSCGGDFDDFIIAASRTAPTPVPAAVWLLGSGLLGVMGFKRSRESKA